MSVLFKNHRWIGEFFFPDNYEHRFFGEINYSPDQGPILSYTIYNFKYLFKSGSKTNILYGILSTGEKCTILFLGGMDFKTTFTNLRLNNYLPNALGKIGL
ncbi:hypothetical protein [Arsenophonus nasoniae]|uniref:ApeA N-terminal domain-containing protein n=1 Tax=Arsenophonus nasoniae TaxID=638 RepID=A0AA95K6X3_9GAMM|nr:hypothetical protein [Arsenophonus nasoniae]WGL94653.1 hypothetical protein QE207_13175 [Arsenophonus nasoniae]